MFTRAEAAAVFLVSFPAVAILLAYGADAVGFALHPIPIALIALGGAVAVGGAVRARSRDGASDAVALLTFVAVMGAWLLWLAWPHMLPIGGGSDLTHHLLLVDYIDRTGGLVHDRALLPYFGEMLDYTPGAHLLAVLAGRWTGTDGLHAMYSVVAVSVAIKMGVVFLIALRCLSPQRTPRTRRHDPTGSTFVSFVSFVVNDVRVALALIAPLLLFLPHRFLIGSFAHDSFLAQVLAELFAVMAWWAIVCWDQQPAAIAAAIFALMGVATFLTWPVWIGPLILTFVAVVSLRRDRPGAGRMRDLAIGTLPIAAIAVAHAIGRVGATSIAGASGFALIPTPAATGWIFPVVGVAGTVAAFRDRRTRTVPLLLVAIVLQAAALVIVARASGAEAPYLALKMFYLAMYPLAVGGAIACRHLRPSWGPPSSPVGSEVWAWLLVALLLIPAARLVLATPRPTPVVSNELLEAGRWARTHVPPACLDYLVADDDSAYWLHVVVLGNPRGTKRSLASETFEPEKALVRWILPGNLPYAIAADVDALPRDIRTNVDTLARFGRAGVIKRRGESSCRSNP